MSLKVDDRVYETSVTTGTGTYALDGAVTGFQAFSALTANNYCPYFATDGTNWEVGIGQVLAGPARLSRSTVLSSSNADAAVNWGAGTKQIRCGLPAALFMPGVTARSSNTILGVQDHGKTFNATSTFTQTLDVAATLGDGWKVQYRNSGTGVITLDPDSAETIDGLATLALQPGDSCTILCNGSAFVTVGLSRAIVRGTEQATTSGTSIDFTGIPSGVRRITVMLVGVSIDATTELLLQLGDAGGFETSGYLSSASALVDASSVSSGNSTTGFILTKGLGSGGVLHGKITLELEDAAGFTWVEAGSLAQSNTAANQVSAGSKSTSDELTQMRITTVSGAANFDAGAMNINYEF